MVTRLMASVAKSKSASGAVPELPVWRFSVEDYRRMGEAGVLTEDDRVELLDGCVVRKMNLNPPHSVTVQAGSDSIRKHLPEGWCIRIQDAITTDGSEPEPDLAVVRGTHRDFIQRHPEPNEIGLVVEVADSSLSRDRYKCQIYGLAGIPVYWIVNLNDKVVEVYTEPTGTADDPKYARCKEFLPGQEVALILDGQTVANIPVDELLP